MLFHRCLSAWLSWVEKVKEERMLKEQHDKRAEKMATLLKAASSGQLWQDKKIEESGCERDAHVIEDLVSIFHFQLYQSIGIQSPDKENLRDRHHLLMFHHRGGGRACLPNNFLHLLTPVAF